VTEAQTPAAPGADRPTVAMLMYSGMTMLDLVGPLETLSQMTDIHLVGLTTDEMISDSGLPFRPRVSIADAPTDVDVLFVPGGEGTAAAMRSPETLEFLADRGARARYVTSVCTGSLVLGAAGLLRGYKATSHWATMHLLTHFGAEPTLGRVVVDRNRLTGGGVTAGIDFGLTLLAEMLGEPAARISQLMLEYDPRPPFDSGSPATADPEHVAVVRHFTEPMNRQIAQDFGPVSVPR
jgi:cyclohexyl-isocyanide hydratase